MSPMAKSILETTILVNDAFLLGSICCLMKLFVPRYANTAWGMKNVNQHMLSFRVGAVLWVSVVLCPPSIRPSLKTAAVKAVISATKAIGLKYIPSDL